MSDREEPASPVPSPSHWCGKPPFFAAATMQVWLVMLRRRRPWNDMPLDDVAGEFRRVLVELLQSRETTAPAVSAARLRRASREHGAFRHRQGCAAVVLTAEIASAMAAMTRVLARTGAGSPTLCSFQESIAPAMRAVERAAYSGHADWRARSD